MDIKAMHSRRKKRANHNFFIITVGFVLMLLVLIFGTQDLMYRMDHKKEVRVLHCEIENKSVATVCKMNVGDVVLFEDSLPQGKTTLDYNWHFDSTQTIVFSLNNTLINFEKISVADSISYLMIEVTPGEIKHSFFE